MFAPKPIAVFSDEQAERLTGVSRAQLRYWARDGFFSPQFEASKTGIPVYSFRDLACLKVLNTLRNKAKVPLQELRRAKERLSHLGDDLWAKTTLFVFGKKVVFQDTSTGTLEEASTGQKIFKVVLAAVTHDIERAVIELHTRTKFGEITRKKTVMRNQPVIADTRIPVRAIKSFHEAGYSIDQIIQQYPSLTPQDVESAIYFETDPIPDVA